MRDKGKIMKWQTIKATDWIVAHIKLLCEKPELACKSLLVTGNKSFLNGAGHQHDMIRKRHQNSI